LESVDIGRPVPSQPQYPKPLPRRYPNLAVKLYFSTSRLTVEKKGEEPLCWGVCIRTTQLGTQIDGGRPRGG